MDILEQCQIWNEQEEYRKIIDALEAVPDESRSPEMDSELARAYNNAAGPEDRTEVYVIPASRFPMWLEAEQADDLEEETLYETSKIWR